jgi:hypothetical protein
MAVLTIVAKVINMAMIAHYRRKLKSAKDYPTALTVSYAAQGHTAGEGQPVGHRVRARVHRG